MSGRVEVSKLTDDQLVAMYQQVGVFNARAALLRLSGEVLNRPSLGDRLDFAAVSGNMAHLVDDPEKSLELLRRARQYAGQRNTSPARYFLLELPLRLLRGDVSEARHIMTMLQTHHMSEPGVSEGLYNILVRFGLVTPDGQIAAPEQAAAADAAAEPGQTIWTPDAAAPAASEKKESQLWVPGMD